MGLYTALATPPRTLGTLGLVIPTQPMSGATGWIIATITAPPNGTVEYAIDGAPSAQVWVKDSTGVLKLWGSGGAGVGGVSWITQGGVVTFYLLPVDADGNAYAPVTSVVVKGQPGIFASLKAPQAKIDEQQQAHSGLQLYPTIPPAPDTPSKNTSSTDPLAFLDTLPGGRTVWLIGAAGFVTMLMLKRKKG